jgi:hypothetical protein
MKPVNEKSLGERMEGLSRGCLNQCGAQLALDRVGGEGNRG